jgi:hypothetical protein
MPDLSRAGSETFDTWYAQHAQQQGLNPNPDDPRQQYDYRAAFRAGVRPDASGHWPSLFKGDLHPNLIVGGVNTKTGEPVRPTPSSDILRQLMILLQIQQLGIGRPRP